MKEQRATQDRPPARGGGRDKSEMDSSVEMMVDWNGAGLEIAHQSLEEDRDHKEKASEEEEPQQNRTCSAA